LPPEDELELDSEPAPPELELIPELLLLLGSLPPELEPELEPEGELEPPMELLLTEITAKSIFPEEGFTMIS